MTTHEPSQLSRRGFLRRSGLTVGAALGTSAPIASAWPAVGADEFPRRVLGRTKLEVTSMTLGAAPSGIADDVSLRDIAEIVNLAIDLGSIRSIRPPSMASRRKESDEHSAHGAKKSTWRPKCGRTRLRMPNSR